MPRCPRAHPDACARWRQASVMAWLLPARRGCRLLSWPVRTRVARAPSRATAGRHCLRRFCCWPLRVWTVGGPGRRWWRGYAPTPEPCHHLEGLANGCCLPGQTPNWAHRWVDRRRALGRCLLCGRSGQGDADRRGTCTSGGERNAPMKSAADGRPEPGLADGLSNTNATPALISRIGSETCHRSGRVRHGSVGAGEDLLRSDAPVHAAASGPRQ
jgi:hypothetical protein